jgi:hypothetical protein
MLKSAKRVALLMLTIGAAWSCSMPSSPEQFGVGDPCRVGIPTCVDDVSVLRCEARTWAITDCETVCAELGPSYLSDGCDDDCVCVLMDPTGCAPSESICIDEYTLARCNDQQIWEPTLCEELCTAAGLLSVGCLDQTADVEPTCWCTGEGAACADAAPSCVDDSNLAICVEGTWVFEDCTSSCGNSAATCDPWQQPVACDCA